MKTKQLCVSITLLIALVITQTGSILAQANSSKLTLKGAVVDSATNTKLAFATVKLNDDKGETKKTGISKEDGSFSFSMLAPSAYHLVIVTLGYAPQKLLIDLQKDTDIGVIAVKQQFNSLKEVAVTSSRPILKRKADRIIYDLQADPESKSNSVLGMMHKIPYVTLDGQEHILLKGNSSFKVLINGKPAPSIENNLSSLLKSMPASTIQEIEVITIPPSKYDGEGLAGIINIITVRKVNNGYSGSLNANESFPVGGPGA